MKLVHLELNVEILYRYICTIYLNYLIIGVLYNIVEIMKDYYSLK